MLDLGIELNAWPWIWLGIGVFFAVIELALLPGSFVILPFALSAFAASIAGFYDVPIEIQWAIFVVGGAILWYVMYRFARRWDDSNGRPRRRRRTPGRPGGDRHAPDRSRRHRTAGTRVGRR